jgi:dipeptidyl-peptidase-4
MLLPSEASHPTPPDFGQPPTFAQRVNNVYTDPKITPNWIDNSDCFWYRVRSNPEESTFIYVDPNRGIREPAFNHAELAQALTSPGIHANEINFPFTHIDPTIDGKAVRFKIGEKKFQFLNNNLPTEHDGDIFTEETLQPLKEEKVSVTSTTSTAIVFINQFKVPVSIHSST